MSHANPFLFQASVKPFQGSGHVLGSVVPPVVGEPSASAASATPAPSDDQMKDLVLPILLLEGGGLHSTQVASILAYNPATLGSNPIVPEKFSVDKWSMLLRLINGAG